MEGMISDKCYILSSISLRGNIGNKLQPANVGTTLKAPQKDLRMDFDKQPLSGQSFRVGTALELLEQAEPLEKIMLRRGG